LWRYTPAVPDVHFDKSGRFDSLDVHSIAVIEDGKVRSEARRLDELAQMRYREFAQSHALHCLSTETQNSNPERVVSGVGVASHVSTADEGT
jgi:hypothetical protein